MSETLIGQEVQALAPGETTPDRGAGDVPFFVVGVPKFIALNLCTFGLYQVFWWYQPSKRVRGVGENVWPWLRTLLAGAFSYFFFDRVNEQADRQGAPALLTPGFLALAYFMVLTSASWALRSG